MSGNGHSRLVLVDQGRGPGGGARRLSIRPTIAHSRTLVGLRGAARSRAQAGVQREAEPSSKARGRERGDLEAIRPPAANMATVTSTGAPRGDIAPNDRTPHGIEQHTIGFAGRGQASCEASAAGYRRNRALFSLSHTIGPRRCRPLPTIVRCARRATSGAGGRGHPDGLARGQELAERGAHDDCSDPGLLCDHRGGLRAALERGQNLSLVLPRSARAPFVEDAAAVFGVGACALVRCLTGRLAERPVVSPLSARCEVQRLWTTTQPIAGSGFSCRQHKPRGPAASRGPGVALTASRASADPRSLPGLAGHGVSVPPR